MTQDTRKFFDLYISLLPRAYDCLHGIRSFELTANRPIYQWRVNQQISSISSSAAALGSFLNSFLLEGETPKRDRFFTQTFQDFMLSRIRALTDVGLRWETTGVWSSVFLILRRFITDAQTVFKSYGTPMASINGGQSYKPDACISAFEGFVSSNIKLGSLTMKTIRDWQNMYLTTLENQPLEDFEPGVQYIDIYDTVRHLKESGFFKQMGYGYYEDRLGKETVRLVREFMSIK